MVWVILGIVVVLLSLIILAGFDGTDEYNDDGWGDGGYF